MRTNDTVWIDITDLLRWRAHPTGTQRLTNDVIIAYSTIREVRLFYYSERLFRLLELDVSSYLKATSHIFDTHGAWPAAALRHHVLPLVRSKGRACGFRKGDQILLLGGRWRTTAIINALARTRAKRGVSVHRFVHDVMPLTEPQFFHPTEISQFAKYMRRMLDIADSLVTSSHWNVQRINSLFRSGSLRAVPLEQVSLGCDSLLSIEPRTPRLGLASREYLLAVGSLDVRKNQRIIYQAYKLAIRQGLELPVVVLAGQPGRMQQECLHLIRRDPALRGKVVIVTHVGDRELVWLYKNCLFTIYPSLCEGWGSPIGESLAFGRLSLSSNTSAMPEVGGRFARYFDPYDPSELLDLILSHLDTNTLKNAEDDIARNFQASRWIDVCVAIEQSIS
jgi:glycosyltransferase involved in cell wall biosynthesis